MRFPSLCCNLSSKNVHVPEESPMLPKLDEDVARATWVTAPPYVPVITTCKVIKVYDGDTITIAAKIYESSPVYRFSVRLRGIDTPEIKTKSETEKHLAIKARDFLADRIMDKVVVLQNVSTEKYGRLLADVYYDGCLINELMLTSGHAVKYDGGTKEIPPSWLDGKKE